MVQHGSSAFKHRYAHLKIWTCLPSMLLRSAHGQYWKGSYGNIGKNTGHELGPFTSWLQLCTSCHPDLSLHQQSYIGAVQCEEPIAPTRPPGAKWHHYTHDSICDWTFSSDLSCHLRLSEVRVNCLGLVGGFMTLRCYFTARMRDGCCFLWDPIVF